MTTSDLNLTECPILMRSRTGHCDRSSNESFRALQALVPHRREQNTASDRRSTPVTQDVPHSGHTTLPAPFSSA
ncbi:hypothetical protein GCM10010302_05400 [Streptomyces polychromogenes]|uniref:Uncharacterized protein n=1 Tax=Streptomyces polychromogenes TaxID=67342 RepID=A0ABN0V1R0_9ACTN